MLKIGDFSKLSRISIRMLRHYDEIGLLVPVNIDVFTGYRYYSEAQLPLANRINSLKAMGFSLLNVAAILKNYDDSPALKQFLVLKQTELSEEIEEGKRRLLLLGTAIKHLEKDDKIMKYNVTLKELPERCVASVRKVIPSYDAEGMLWGILMQETAELKIQADDPCYCVAVFHDGEYKESDVDVEIQKTVKGRYQDTANVKFKVEPSIMIASAVYKGSYEQIDEVNSAVANWIKDNDYEFEGAMFNIYHVSPHETDNPDEWVTEVCYPVKKR